MAKKHNLKNGQDFISKNKYEDITHIKRGGDWLSTHKTSEILDEYGKYLLREVCPDVADIIIKKIY